MPLSVRLEQKRLAGIWGELPCPLAATSLVQIIFSLLQYQMLKSEVGKQQYLHSEIVDKAAQCENSVMEIIQRDEKVI
jgi:hypothetical protein